MIALLSIRLTEKFGLHPNLPHIFDDENLTNFINTSSKAVVIFANDNDDINFATYGISHHFDTINFTIAPRNFSKKYRCRRFPCFVPFENGERMDLDKPQATSIAFTRWIKSVESPYRQNITTVESLRLALLSFKPVLFAVGLRKVPSKVPENVKVFIVSIKIMKSFGLNLKKGMYAYDPIERALNPISEDFESIYNTTLVHPLGVPIHEKPYVAGYFYEADNFEQRDQFINITQEIISQLEASKDFFFTVLPFSSENQPVIDAGMFGKAQPPFFFVYNTTAPPSNKRWLIQKPHRLLDSEYIGDFLIRVSERKQPYSLLSALPSESPLRYVQELCTMTLKKRVSFDIRDDVLLAITTEWCTHCPALKRVLNNVGAMVAPRGIRIASIDAGANELPQKLIPPTEEFPALYFFRGGEHRRPIPVTGPRDADHILRFLAENAQVPFDPSLVDDADDYDDEDD